MPGFPRRFGDYLLVASIAEGGMAEIYLARPRRGDGGWRAIKCLRAKLARQERFQEMFGREARLATLLVHPNVVRSYEVGTCDGQCFIAMEYVAGQDLSAVLRRLRADGGELPIPLALHIARMICRGLHHAHELTNAQGRPLNVVNRDVSPANVRLSYEGQVKLLDFGIAQAALALTSEIGVVKGKLPYMSPEQARGLPLDRRSDLFSTGIVLHELLTGRRVFAEQSEFELRERVRLAEIAPPSHHNARVPPSLDALVMRALERERDARYADAAAFEAALAAVAPREEEGTQLLATFLTERFAEAYRDELSREVASDATGDAPRRSLRFAARQAQAPSDRGYHAPFSEDPHEAQETAPHLAPVGPGKERPSLWTWLASAALLLVGASLLYWATRAW